MASTRNARVHLCVGLQVSGYRRLLIALLFSVTTIAGVHCIATDGPVAAPQEPTPTQDIQNFTSFHQYEADALNAVLKSWTELNPQLSTILNWSPDQHPCNSSMSFNYSNTQEFEGAWLGVVCTPVLQESNATGNYYEVSVSTLMLRGSNVSCASDGDLYISQQCGFDGIKGELPSEISRLRNLDELLISHNPELIGPVPVEICQMPNLKHLFLRNNSLVGTVPSNFINPFSKLESIDLSNNNFSGSLIVSSHGTLFSTSLQELDLSGNQLGGPVDFQGLNASTQLSFLDLRNNRFSGTFSTGPYFDLVELLLSNNDFTGIRFANYTGLTESRGSGTVYMPSLTQLDVRNNKFSGPFPAEILQMPSLEKLDLSGNSLSGSVDFRAMDNSSITQLKSLDLSRNKLFGSVDFEGIEWISSLTYLNISNNNFNKTFFAGPHLNPQEMDLSNNYFKSVIFDIYNHGNKTQMENDYMPSLIELYIQNNKLSGRFPAHMLTVANLQILHGGQNQFETLQVPEIPFENSTLLMVILTDNHINAIQYANKGRFTTYNLQFSNLLFLGGNPICNKIESELLSTICRINRSSPILNVLAKSNTKNTVIIATSTSTAFVFMLLVTALYVWRLMRRIKSLRLILGEFEKKEVKPNLYSYREIKLATNNFDPKNKLGKGGFGVVYKGELFDGTIVAVKKLTMSSGQVLSEFLNEVVVISGLKHRNLVKLKGCCLGDGDQRMLVFECVENKNLAEAMSIHDNLIDNFEPPYLDWAMRFNIIVGIARGLTYLHEELQSPVIHRDIKTTNILLDKNYDPKIADFGLAYFFPALDNEASHLTLMQVAGTRGYCSPEYALHGHISTALDVYSFGIVVLETVSGRKNIDIQKAEEQVYLREWAWRQFEAQASLTLVDPKMNYSSTDSEVIMRVISVALACVHFKAAKRPKMHDVVLMLLGNMPISDFCMGFEYGEALEAVASNFSMTFDTTSSL